jgi:hypothetical protein
MLDPPSQSTIGSASFSAYTSYPPPGSTMKCVSERLAPIPRRRLPASRELLHHGQLLSTVKGSHVGEHLDAYVVALALDVGDGSVGECVHERGRVVAKRPRMGDLARALPRGQLGVGDRGRAGPGRG